MTRYGDPATRPSLDPSRYSLEEDERQFFALLTGINDEEELKKHILAVQEKAYQVYGYPCIRRFSFAKLKIARLPGYPKALKLLEQRKDPILLDIGCCFGNDARKAVVDGWPAENVVASDLRPEFWNFGHELFKSTPKSFPATFIAGDVFSPATLDISDTQPSPNSNSTTEVKQPPPIHPLRDLTSLTPLKHRLSAIHASSFFHLFPEDSQRELARRLAFLLLPEKVARPEKGFRFETVRKDNDGTAVASEIRLRAMFCHSPESWKKLWEEDIFGPHQDVKVKVDAELQEVELWDYRDLEPTIYLLNWSIEVV
ncbi:Methyltransferase adrK [Psilocybe cubensis]|uniref:Methyltransferase ausD n=2 Tax=Psilocybe cubensis TaxID=181762 RepID=A0A8H8CM56_PSICU|nr:Methyltransferase adrK [Psilocybe cubensis]KAH9481460.1 Methyltransferase adrK [Psilocybe cubensis]